MGIGSRICEAREKIGMSQQELADRVYVTQQTVSKWNRMIHLMITLR